MHIGGRSDNGGYKAESNTTAKHYYKSEARSKWKIYFINTDHEKTTQLPIDHWL